MPGLGQLYSFATKWTVQLTLPLFGLLWLIPGVIVRMIFGTKYLAAVPALRIMALGYLVLCLMGPASHALIVLGKPKMILYGTAGGALAAVFIGLVTVPIYGAVGGAGAVAAGQVATAIILVTIACTAVKLNLLERSCLQMVIMILYPLIIIGATAAGFEGLMGHYLPPLLIVLVTSIVLVSAALLMSITTLSGTDRLVLDDIKRSLRPSLSQNSEDET